MSTESHSHTADLLWCCAFSNFSLTRLKLLHIFVVTSNHSLAAKTHRFLNVSRSGFDILEHDILIALKKIV